MICISMTTVDVNGHVVLNDIDSDFGTVYARVSRVATLDGGAVFVQNGISNADRTFRIKAKITESQKETIEHIFNNSTYVNISCSEGFFIGSISSIDTSSQDFTATILIKSKEI